MSFIAEPRGEKSMSHGSVPPDPVPDGHPPIRFLAFDDLEEVVGEPPGFDGVQLNRRLFDRASAGTPHLIAEVITFKPDFIHHMHRHSNAEQVMVPLQGSVVMLDEARSPRELGAGEAMVVPRLRWHEVRNESGADCVVLNLFSGLGDISELGFEAYPRD
jgi:quercetin dioxygenase-like cupin family protein